MPIIHVLHPYLMCSPGLYFGGQIEGCSGFNFPGSSKIKYSSSSNEIIINCKTRHAKDIFSLLFGTIQSLQFSKITLTTPFRNDAHDALRSPVTSSSPTRTSTAHQDGATPLGVPGCHMREYDHVLCGPVLRGHIRDVRNQWATAPHPPGSHPALCRLL